MTNVIDVAHNLANKLDRMYEELQLNRITQLNYSTSYNTTSPAFKKDQKGIWWVSKEYLNYLKLPITNHIKMPQLMKDFHSFKTVIEGMDELISEELITFGR